MIGILAAVVLVILFLLVTLFVGLIFEALAEEGLEGEDASGEDDKEVTLNVYGNDGSCYFSGRFKSKNEALEKFDQIRKSIPVSRFTIEY